MMLNAHLLKINDKEVYMIIKGITTNEILVYLKTSKRLCTTPVNMSDLNSFPLVLFLFRL